MKKILTVFAFCLGLAGSLAAFFVRADFDRMHWQFRKAIGCDTCRGFVLVDLDQELLNHANDTLSDLRIMADNGTETPYTLVAQGDQTTLAQLPARLYDKQFVSDAYTLFTLDLGVAGQLHNRVVLQTPSENFRRMVEVEAGADGQTWATLTTRGQIYDYTVRDIKPVKVQDTAVDYPESTLRYLRIKILDRGEPPLVISGTNVLREVRTVAKESEFRPAYTVSQNATEQTTEVVADLGIRGIPTRKASLAIAGENFNRSVVVYASDNAADVKAWQILGTFYLFRINTPKFQGENVTPNYPETQKRFLKFVVYNRDDQPLTFTNIRLFGILRKVAFRAETSRSYAIYYGNGNAHRPAYDMASLFPYLDVPSMQRVSLGAEEPNPTYTPPKPPLTERKGYVLPAALGVMVAIMLLLLLRLFLRTKKTHAF